MRRFAQVAVFSVLCFTNAALAGQISPAGSTPADTSKPRTTAHMATDPLLLHPEKLTAKAPDVYQVKLATTKGDIVVEVTRAWAPVGADRFYNLVKHGFYNDAAFFRIVPAHPSERRHVGERSHRFNRACYLRGALRVG